MTSSKDETLLDASTPQPIEPGNYRWDVPDGWQQGRGAYGGLGMAAVLRAAEDAREHDDRSIRTLNATLCGPVLAEPADVTVEIVREGRNTTAMTVAIRQEGTVRVQANLFLGRERHEDGNWSTVEPPDELVGQEASSYREAEVADLPEPLAPRFSTHFEYRPLRGVPFSSSPREVTGWIRPRAPGERRDAAYLAANMDAYWPAAYAAFESPRPMGTVSFSMQCLADWEGLDGDAPLFYTSESPVARDGYARETRRLWGYDGRLMAVNEQSICLIK